MIPIFDDVVPQLQSLAELTNDQLSEHLQATRAAYEREKCRNKAQTLFAGMIVLQKELKQRRL